MLCKDHNVILAAYKLSVLNRMGHVGLVGSSRGSNSWIRLMGSRRSNPWIKLVGHSG